jgi:hypothetical protein
MGESSSPRRARVFERAAGTRVVFGKTRATRLWALAILIANLVLGAVLWFGIQKYGR